MWPAVRAEHQQIVHHLRSRSREMRLAWIPDPEKKAPLAERNTSFLAIQISLFESPQRIKGS
jgi:hypothetical protein